MAVLNKIRQRSVFLIAIIALALFAFVLSDLFRNSTAFSGSQDVIATIEGEDIHRESFMSQVEMVQRQMGPNGTSTQAMNRVWDQEVRKVVLQKQFEELGLSVEKDQMRELLKQNLASIPDFSNEAGVFDENKLNEFIANLKAISPERAPLGNSMINYSDWVESENSIAVSGQQQTYFNMIKAGISSTLGEAQVEYNLENETVDLQYVQVPYSTISDSLVNISKSEISDYIDKHKKKFEVEASRDINFVEFKEVASLEDEDEINKNVVSMMNDRVEYNDVSKLNDTVLGFKNAKDIETFINTYSDVKYNDAFVKKESFPTTIQDSLFKLGVGEYYGPYKDGGMYKMTKIVAEKNLPDSVKARHILIPFLGSRSATEETIQTEEQAKATADSLLKVIKADRKKFVSLLDFSADKVSNEKEGVLDWYAYNAMVPAFRDYTFENKTGDLGVVKSDFGFHVIEILGQKGESKLIKVATLGQKIEASERTIDAAFNNVSNFEIAIQDKDFQEVAKEKDLAVKPVNGMKELDENIPGLGSQRPIVRWAFEDGTKVGDTKRFSIPGGGYVVVQLSGINKKGLMSVEAASATVIPEIRKEKKAKMIREKIKGTTVEEIAKNQNVATTNASAVNMKNPTLSGAGLEPKVVGAAFGLKVGESTGLIDGDKGVYKVKVTNKTEAPKLDNYQAVANRLTTARVNEAQTKVYNALKEAADIEDHRAKFY
ncbi:SurA N-terminal domain-containing protein [Subsaxibacter sp. CAU 1640]|uniref:SurA N-terminal domain-containing protein n=1 Tax=Subsaxibacter sp. CAU 1640 TaxID=2933271 RepID=UPI002004A703|nr:SurA N-terminal domain-containing protein [Subsaxibacter sp. CAU 1640]MCK7588996.1 SurA N-terminal domain-containing protein [Subsaxibacter sp. CAU 1640]